MILHLADSVREEILLHTVDTDVVVLAVAAAAKLDIRELWVAFGMTKKFMHIPVHEISLLLALTSPMLCQYFMPTLGMTLFHHST